MIDFLLGLSAGLYVFACGYIFGRFQFLGSWGIK